MRKLIGPLIATLCAFSASIADAREAPRMVALSTGSNIATWTLPASPVPGTKIHQTPVIYLHGGPGMYTEDRRIEMGQAFRAAGFTTVYYDQIGGGQSARIPASQYNLARMIGDLEALRISLGTEKLVLWGNSWGAQLAVLYGQAYPSRVAAFVLTAPGGFPGETIRRNYGVTKRTTVTIGRDLTAAINQIDRKGGAAEPAISQVDSGRLLDAVVSADMLEGMVCKASTLTQADLPGGANLFTNRIIPKEVVAARPNWTTMPRVPSLIVRGSCDFLPVTSADRYVAITAGARIDVTNVGHGLLEDPAGIERILGTFARDGLAGVP
jgi:pimeloyl-ACP methyl ester carboxylesterase